MSAAGLTAGLGAPRALDNVATVPPPWLTLTVGRGIITCFVVDPVGNQAIDGPDSANGTVDDKQQGDENVAPSVPAVVPLSGSRSWTPPFSCWPTARGAAARRQVACKAKEASCGCHDGGGHERENTMQQMTVMPILEVPFSDH